MISYDISRMTNPTTMGLFGVTVLLALRTTTRSSSMISLCRNVTLLMAFVDFYGAINQSDVYAMTDCSIVLQLLKRFLYAN